MSKHLQRDLENLQGLLLSLSGRVEQMIGKAIRALENRDAALARQVIESDPAIDAQEVRIEEECLKLLALHQPVAIDLRRIATVLKVNSDLERMADLAVNIAERAQALVEEPEIEIPEDLGDMVELTTSMVRRALDALVQLDLATARAVCADDERVDQLNRRVITHLIELMESGPDKVQAALHCFSASRHLERIADHATNIAEDVIYLVDGEIARHVKFSSHP